MLLLRNNLVLNHINFGSTMIRLVKYAILLVQWVYQKVTSVTEISWIMTCFWCLFIGLFYDQECKSVNLSTTFTKPPKWRYIHFMPYFVQKSCWEKMTRVFLLLNLNQSFQNATNDKVQFIWHFTTFSKIVKDGLNNENKVKY